ncbi:MAG TPA: type IV pilus twitching motility protein PilT [Planctomycetota bacterium]|nr:type IV pilus twitching motility protein PilT [Planctomycetota bacterium]
MTMTGQVEISKLLDICVKHEASDLHIRVGRPPVVRVNGSLRNVSGYPILTPEMTFALMKSIASEKSQSDLNENGGADFGFSYGTAARFRVSIFREKHGVGVVCRQIPTKLRTFDEIGLPPVIKDICMRPRGLVLVTGPTGSGKTSTLAAMLDFINQERRDHIITVEDPIEYHHPHKNCVVTQREVYNDVPSFSEALRRGLRQDPDVFLVGEMRDLETIEAAVTASETGHLVFGTLHTTGAAETVDRIIDVFPTNQQNQIRAQLAQILEAVISQTLIPREDKPGRIAAFELMFCSDAIRSLIRKGETFKIDSHIQIGAKDGNRLLDDHLFELWSKKIISYHDMMVRASQPGQLEQKVRESGRSVPGGGGSGRPGAPNQSGRVLPKK